MSILEISSGAETSNLKRSLGSTDVIFFMMANVIGVGIFLTPSKVASAIQNPYWFLLVWLIGGLIALSGALTYAELGVLMPRAGGDYVFLRQTYGKSIGFMYGYLSFTISYSGSIAALATGVVQYQGRSIFGNLIDTILINLPFFNLQLTLGNILPIIIILLLTYINYFGLKNSITIQKLITVGPIIILIISGLLIVSNFFPAQVQYEEILKNNFANSSISNIPGFTAIAVALIPIYFSYSGWNVSLFLSEDIKNPTRIIPKSMIWGILIIIGIYLLFCFVFLITIPYEVLSSKKSLDVVSTVGAVILGSNAKKVTAVIIGLIILGSLNSSIISGSRVYLAMARDKIFFKQANHIHAKYGTPHWSLWSQAIWACLLIIILKNFDAILELTTVMLLFMSIMVVGSIFVLRIKFKDHPHFSSKNDKKVYRTFGYPLIPIIYIVSTLFVLIFMIASNKQTMIWGITGISIITLGFLVYYFWSKSSNNNNNNNSKNNNINQNREKSL